MQLKPISQLKADLGINVNGRVQAFFTDTCYKHMDKYVPKDTGNLRTIVVKDINSITYESPYAHAQYVGIVHGSPVQNYTTSGTCSYWDKKMWSAEKDSVIKEVQEYVNGNK